METLMSAVIGALSGKASREMIVFIKIGRAHV